MEEPNIQRINLTTAEGNTLSIFYNPDINLFVADLIHKNNSGGNTLISMHLNEQKLLKHCCAG